MRFWHPKERRAASGPGWQLLLAALPLAGSIAAVVYRLVGPTVYPDFLVGPVTLAAESKRGDFWIVPSLLVGFGAALTGLVAVESMLRRRCGESASHGFRTLVAYASLPFVLWLGSLALASHPALETTHLSAILVSTVGLLSVLTSRRLFAPSERDFTEMVGASTLAPLLAAASGAALGLVLSRTWAEPPVAGARLMMLLAGGMAGVALAGVAVIWLATPPAETKRLRRRLWWALLVAQLPLPAAFWVLIPTPFRTENGIVQAFRFGPALYALVGCLMLAAWAQLAFKPSRSRGRVPSPLSAIAPICMAAIVVMIKLPQVILPFGLAADDYHLGEVLLPWWLWRDFGLLPYVDFSPAHGFIDVAYGLVADLFFDGSAGSIAAAGHLLMAALTIVVVLALAQVAGPLVACLFGFLVPAVGLAYLAVASVLCLLGRPELIDRRIRWLGTWVVLGTCLVLLSPGKGLAFVLATLPFGLWLAWLSFRTEPRRLRNLLLVLGGIAVLSALLTDWGRILWGALRYALESSSINEIAFATKWELPQPDAIPSSVGLWELTRHGWVLIALMSLLVLGRSLALPRGIRRQRLLLFSSSILLFMLVLVPYTMGRNPPAGFARTGLMTGIAFSVFLPILTWSFLPRGRRTRALTLTFLLACTLAPLHGFSPLHPTKWMGAATRMPRAPEHLVDGRRHGLPNMGRHVMKPADLHRLRSLQKHLRAWLRPGETYLDLTNRNAQYFYLGYPVPIESGAYYNLVHRRQQLRSIERLRADPPPVVLISGDNLDWGGWDLSLRSHLLYRYLLQQPYRVVYVDGLTFMVLPARLADSSFELPGALQTSGLTDRWWTNGVALPPHARFLVSNRRHLVGVQPGDELDFARSGTRVVRRISHDVVTVGGPPLDPELDGRPHPIVVKRRADHPKQLRLALLEFAMRKESLALLPVAWGRASELAERARRVAILDEDAPVRTLKGATEIAPGRFLMSGTDSRLRYLLWKPTLRGVEAGLLGLDFTCKPAHGESRLKISWKVPGPRALRQENSVQFQARNGPILVPLDTSPRWLLARRISRLQIEIVDSGTCRAITIGRAELLQRLDADRVDGPRNRSRSQP